MGVWATALLTFIMEIKVYKIWDTEKQLFSKGGSDCDTNPRRWSKQGKAWGQLSWVKSHLNLYVKSRFNKEVNKWVFDNYIPDSWEVVEISSVTGERRFKAKEL